jgi:hypothetical protein
LNSATAVVVRSAPGIKVKLRYPTTAMAAALGVLGTAATNGSHILHYVLYQFLSGQVPFWATVIMLYGLIPTWARYWYNFWPLVVWFVGMVGELGWGGLWLWVTTLSATGLGGFFIALVGTAVIG